jgi:hypothetical protein
MNNHTPGEWVVVAPARKGGRYRVNVRGIHREKEVWWDLAVVENGAPGDTLETEGANARLIAAAPAMLKLLIDAERDAGDVWLQKCRELLSKIEGNPSDR